MSVKRTVAAAFVLALAACGQSGTGGAGGSSANSATCQLLGDPTPLFGANAIASGYGKLAGGAVPASCEFQSADGAKAGEVVTIENATPAQLQETLQKWDAQTETPLAPVDGLGEGAQMATDLPGYQTQIAFLKGTTLVLIQARTSELESAHSADLAKRMAAAVAGALH
ncbi:MAG: hypothetical protein QM759_16155 [Terricaulis sp.]